MSSTLFEQIADRDFKARTTTKTMTQVEKTLLLIPILLIRLLRNAACSKQDVENDAVAAGLPGRTSVQLGAGIGGKCGLMLLISNSEILCCKDNVINCVKRLGAGRFAKFLADNELTEEQFDEWFSKLPSAS